MHRYTHTHSHRTDVAYVAAVVYHIGYQTYVADHSHPKPGESGQLYLSPLPESSTKVPSQI